MTSSLGRLACLGLAVLATACGAAPPRLARIEPLPELPFPLEDGPRELRTAWARAEALLAEPAPQPPSRGFATLDEAGAWASESLLPWAHDYLEDMSDVTDPLAGAIALDGSLRVFCASIAAALYERIFGVLTSVPVPTEIEDDPELVLGYRGAFADALGESLGETRGLLEECVTRASERADAAAWGADCEERLRRLP